MAQLFRYRARNLAGQLVTGKVEAENTGTAVALLRKRDLFVVGIAPITSFKLDLHKLFAIKIKTKELAVLCRQFATMVGAGIPLLQSLTILVQQTENKQLQKILEDVRMDIEKGKSLSDAFKVHQGQFPDLFINMLVAGEISGTLDQTLLRLAVHFEKEHELQEKIKSAMTYPLFVAGIAIVAVIILLVLIVPVFVDVFAQMGASLPLPTRMIIGISSFLAQYWYLPPLVLIALFFVSKHILATEKGKWFFDCLLLKLPVIGPVVNKTIVARFASTFATLIKSGVPLLQSLETVEKVTGNSIAAAELAEARANIKEGEQMAPVLLKSKVFPPMAVNMIAIGEESGALEEMLEKLAAFYEREIEETIARLSSIIEPLMIVAVGVLVGFIAIAIYLPLFGLSSAIEAGSGL
jgi:type IV pilus assembly protein PilC